MVPLLPGSHLHTHSTSIYRAVVMCQGKCEGKAVSFSPGKNRIILICHSYSLHSIVSASVAHLSPRKQTQQGEWRHYKLQALIRDEDSWMKEATNLPWSHGCETVQLSHPQRLYYSRTSTTSTVSESLESARRRLPLDLSIFKSNLS
jgi:hypothetical protein